MSCFCERGDEGLEGVEGSGNFKRLIAVCLAFDKMEGGFGNHHVLGQGLDNRQSGSAEFHTWLIGHPKGFVVNSDEPPSAGYLILHTSQCRTLRDDRHKNYAGADYRKTCSTSKAELDAWAKDTVGGRPKPCAFCKP